MAADLHIHIFEGIEEATLAAFNSNTFGSKYFAPRTVGQKANDNSFEEVSRTPSIWIGSVSWLKAALLGGNEYVPSPVEAINAMIGEDLPLLTEEMKQKILSALDIENATQYHIAEKSEVESFLNAHIGKPLFTVSW